MNRFWELRNYEKEKEKIIEFIRGYFKKSNKTNAVIGLSGGIDSSAAVALLSAALGNKKVFAYYLPTKMSNLEDEQDAKLIAELFGINFKVIPIDKHLESYIEDPEVRKNDNAVGNIQARLRMIELYKINEIHHKGLVVGTSNKTEILLGYTTKWGDSACDFNPLKDLYKTEVRELAKHLKKIPDSIISKAPSPRLVIGQTDEGELAGLIDVEYSGKPYELYEKIDPFFYYWLDLKNGFYGACSAADMSHDAGMKLVNIYHKNEHKRKMPSSLLEVC